MHLKKPFLFFLLFTALKGQAQDTVNTDTLKAWCSGPVFWSCEEMPYLKKGATRYAAALLQKCKDSLPPPGRLTLRLTILTTGEIKYVTVEKGRTDKLQALISAIKSLSDAWVPGLQNKHKVCCYRRLEITVTPSDLDIFVPDGM